MRHITHAWAAMAALGAGLIHLAVAASAPAVLLVAFMVVGIAEILWSVLTLARSRYMLPRLYPLLALVPLAIWALGVFSGVESTVLPPMSLALATVLSLLSAGFVAVSTRRGSADESTREPTAGRTLVGFLVGAFAMAAIALPALGQTSAGIAASQGPHAHHSTVDVPEGHTGH
jgi:hypothetical protein